jgi:phosphate-selective porin OprO/OprP
MGDHAWVFGVESAFVEGPYSVQAEYVHQEIATNSGPDASLHGYYAFASYFPTGEHRPYRNDRARFSRVDPSSDFHSNREGGGALEVGIRYSHVEAENVPTGNDALEDWSLGLNWYLNSNSRILTNYVLGDLDSLGGKFHGVTLRLQVAF